MEMEVMKMKVMGLEMGRDEDEVREGRVDIGIGKGVRMGMTRMEGGWGGGEG